MPFLFPLLAILIWAANTVVSKAAAGVLDPAAISFYRWVIAALALSPFCLPQLWRRRAEIRPWLGKLLVLALLGMVLYQCLAYYAAHSTSATNMGVIGSLIPLLTLLQSGLLLRPEAGQAGAARHEPLPVRGALAAGSGQPPGTAARRHQSGRRPDAARLGQLCPLWPADPPLATAVRPLAQPLPADPAGGAAADPGGPLCRLLAVPAEGWSLVLFAGLASSLFAAYCWMRGLATLGAERTSVFMNLMPLCTALIAVITLGEPIHGYHLLGGGLILTGVMISQLKPRARRPLPEGA
jgi:drug/metabolite transporter (DMT)-like permease